uniref:Transcription initiation factor TFIID subunit 10 n=1 Tax=Mantoniella antarctica TaxID=81844 RepID=A0A7S0X614_9CHLO|mmetsp:Transcript_21937/g.54253  ORF Transcript_21937/g.54253 Transcript_21937/m.54253 type:complete len:275 (+) Transcript_21937:131-955(+)|eukprot:CAMPEP_0181369314 /NCGR_PEP_ID=MMETSP1106-20121128/12697_1 /TAXON_ID=81844 /ORGANISM="Mantoniella antarctica, Strain SL-175" /LENGTH=274 /DNA_ID=CAMNT_0023485773 /DNA_START=59 /DNA_END=883 /DNA_ORIENTATION=-
MASPDPPPPLGVATTISSHSNEEATPTEVTEAVPVEPMTMIKSTPTKATTKETAAEATADTAAVDEEAPDGGGSGNGAATETGGAIEAPEPEVMEREDGAATDTAMLIATDTAGAVEEETDAGGSGSDGDEREAPPPSMTPNIPGIDGMSEEDIAAFMETLDEFTPTIPDGLTNHYLKMSGIKEPDVRITRLISLATQKFISQIAQDSRQCAIQRTEMQFRDKRDRGYDTKDKRVVMTMDDLSAALTEYGVNVNKPPYFAGGAAEGSSKKPRTQ